jgi:hypothetical protein
LLNLVLKLALCGSSVIYGLVKVCVYALSWACGGAHTGTTGFDIIFGE